MSSTPQVVDGEASESDTEIELGTTPEVELKQEIKNEQASVISGEASESDEEEKPSPTLQHEPPSPLPRLTDKQMKMYHNSLLHHRLLGSNTMLRKRMEILGVHNIKMAYEKLASLNRELLTLQESMRATDNQIYLARARSNQLMKQLKTCQHYKALPNIKHD